MTFMAEQVVREIKERLNIVEVVSGYIPVKKAGTNFKAACPFHGEKTPSLMVSPQKQIWHCFGCGEGGDVFNFVMRYENIDFREALKLLADRTGVVLPRIRQSDPAAESEKETAFRINDFAARFYHKVLLADSRAEPARRYLRRRGLNEAVWKKWQIGCAPEDYGFLQRALSAKGVTAEQAVKAGVVLFSEKQMPYDRFRGRITFPIFDFQGRTVGFSARIMPVGQNDPTGVAKYVNSPETVIYNKSRVLFGLNFAKNSIRKAEEAVVVEGQMDCIAAHTAGFENVVASSGTALTIEQLSLIARLAHNLKFCFDADSAGQAACRRAGELALKQGFRVKVILLQQAKDPDELIRKSPGLWSKAVAEARWFVDWQMDAAEQACPDPVELKHYLTANVAPLIAAVTDPLEQDHYLRRLVERFSVSERPLRDLVRKLKAGLPLPERESPETGRPTHVLEKEILGGLLAFPEFAGQALSQLTPDEFQDREIGRLVGMLSQGQGETVANETLAKEAVFMVESGQNEPGAEGTSTQLRNLAKSFAMFKVGSIKRRQEALSAEIRQAESRTQKDLLQDLTRRFSELSALRLQFEKLI